MCIKNNVELELPFFIWKYWDTYNPHIYSFYVWQHVFLSNFTLLTYRKVLSTRKTTLVIAKNQCCYQEYHHHIFILHQVTKIKHCVSFLNSYTQRDMRKSISIEETISVSLCMQEKGDDLEVVDENILGIISKVWLLNNLK